MAMTRIAIFARGLGRLRRPRPRLVRCVRAVRFAHRTHTPPVEAPVETIGTFAPRRTSTVGRDYHDSYSCAFLSSAGKFYLYSYTCRDSLVSHVHLQG